jgi:D-3-phosphoglycerate dehydrogenase
MPKTPETTGMIGAEQFALMKPTAYVVNVARGGLIDEEALYTALTTGEIAGAGLDVFTSEPPKEDGTAFPLLSLPNVVVTPHLGASTDEAQEKAGISVARSVKLASKATSCPTPSTSPAASSTRSCAPASLSSSSSARSSRALRSALTSLDIEVRGELAAYDVSVYRLAALKGIFTKIVSENVSYVNAPLFAEQRGIETRLIVEADSPLYRNITILRGTLADGTVLTVAGLAGTAWCRRSSASTATRSRCRSRSTTSSCATRTAPASSRSTARSSGGGHQHRRLFVAHPDASGAPLGAHGRPARAGRDPREHARRGRRRPVPSDRDHRGRSAHGGFDERDERIEARRGDRPRRRPDRALL